MKFVVQSYFPLHFRLVAWFLPVASIVLLLEGHPIFASLLLVSSLIVITAKYMLWVDKDQLKYQDYLFIAGAKRGAIQSCESFDSVYLKKVNYSQRLNSRGTSNVVEKEKYQAFLKLGDDSTIDLGSADVKQGKFELAQKLANYLQIPFKDYTEQAL